MFGTDALWPSYLMREPGIKDSLTAASRHEALALDIARLVIEEAVGVPFPSTHFNRYARIRVRVPGEASDEGGRGSVGVVKGLGNAGLGALVMPFGTHFVFAFKLHLLIITQVLAHYIIKKERRSSQPSRSNELAPSLASQRRHLMSHRARRPAVPDLLK